MPLDFPTIEKNILKFWKENKIFEKLREKNKGKKPWSFLDGPITANNPMGVHHAWGRTYKDLFQRYKALQGFDQRFQNGFDCQGLWVEVEVEKELGFKNKKDIEKYGIDKFVEKCKERVRKFSRIQTEQSIRLGQWMDWENSYYTMSDENNYAIWRFLKKCWQDRNLYKGRDSVPWCPRCGTAISQHEILTEDYKEITHDSLYVEYPIVGRKNEFLLVWTTTPWTLPGNVAVAVDPKKEYALVSGSVTGNRYYVLKTLAKSLALKVIDTLAGDKLVGLNYISAFDHLPRVKKSLGSYTHKIIAADPKILPVSETEGTGLVHTAPGAGAEDFQLAKKLKLPVIELIDEEANYLSELGEFSGKNAKNHPEIIIDYLKNENGGKYLFDTKLTTHRYPICWRCKKELVWRVVDEWYISMEKLRKPLMGTVKKIKWIPSFGLERELDWLKNMHDWLISKKRYWGLTLPIYECSCGNFEVIGSKEELKERAVEGWQDFDGHSPHRPWVDKVKIKCSKCQKLVSRIPDVGNPWLDAGIVPFSTMNYFSDKKFWKKWFPAELVCESFPGQFKNWFYAIVTMSQVIEKVPPVKTIFGFASVKDEKGEEMHKSKGNAIWFGEAAEKAGVEPMRWMYSRQNPVDNLNFGYGALEEIKRKLLTLYNVFVFFGTYVDKAEHNAISNNKILKKENILDKWIISKFNRLIKTAEEKFDDYNPSAAVLAIENFFINDLSLWYLRRSRRRFSWNYIEEGKKDIGPVLKNKETLDRQQAIETLYSILVDLMKLMAPVMPFFSESLYRDLRTENMPESVHLCDYPKANKKSIDEKLEKEMDEVRNIVNKVLSRRTELGIKVRQPLPELRIQNQKLKTNKELLELIKEEVNVKEIIFDAELKTEIELDTEITAELKEEGIIREVIRSLQEMRKKLELKPQHRISISYFGTPGLNKILEKNEKIILSETKADSFVSGIEPNKTFDLEKEIKVDAENLKLAIIKK